MGLSDVFKAAPVIAQARSFTELAKNATNITDPIGATVGATKLIIDVCAPPQVKYPVKCTILFLQLAMCVSTGGLSSVTSVALSVGTAKQVLEEIVK